MTDSLPRFRVNGVDGGAVSAGDRGLQYGDGVFETIAVRDGRPLRLARHLQRLAAGCVALGLPVPDLNDEARAFCAGVPHAVLKLIVTRGGGGRGYAPPADALPTRVLALYPWPTLPPAWAEQGIAVCWCTTTVTAQPALTGLKHLNRLEQVLARRELAGSDAWQEGLMCDAEGNAVEATQGNLFVVRGGVLMTPVLNGGGVAGIIRAMLIEAAPSLGLVCEQTTLPRAAVETADEAFICNSITGILPLRRIGARELPTTWPVTTQMQRWLSAHGDA
ncbi:MAG: aminodeoxychorismate lyase [Xanthomonadaceae bacterium]|nr:aminodeoxychorismate lyase [Xanthomonadaceae bacterium]